MTEITSAERPNFFRIGFYKLKNPEADLGNMDVKDLNEIALKYLDDNFMKRFIELETLGVKNSYEKSLAKKKESIVALEAAAKYFSETELVKEDCIAYCKNLSALVYESIDKLQYNKDSVAGSFQSSILNEVNKYFFYKKNNPKEEARYAKQTAKREALIAKGKNVDWKVVPKVV